ncbi:multiple C2 and transmembrane domain-containing protein 1-like [Dysidea avara]|uniref:multiple C2 and transmembrane domain-containing protein 1-like n=1 Tax=Dysidea avara TaxID=196820 RepID=UPI00331BE803
MDETNKGESKGDGLQVADDKKGRWNSFRNKGKKQIKKLWKSRKRSKAVEGDSEDDDEVYDYDDRPTMSPDSATSSSIGRVPSITLQRPSISAPSSPDSTFVDAGASTEDEHYSSGRESPKDILGVTVTPSNPKESTGFLSHLRRSPSNFSLSKLWMVHVELISGHNLAIRDRSGTSDPYVKIRLGRQKHRSRIINRNLNPVWNESFSYTTNDLNDLMLFKVYDHDWGSLDDFMGRATVKLTTLNQTDEEEMKLELKDDATSEELGYLLVKLRVESGTTHVADVKDQKSLKKQHKKPSCTATTKCQLWSSILMVTLLRGKSLLAMDDNGFSDPYCKFKLGAQKYKSKVMHKTLDPEWKERFELRMYEEESTSLTVEVWDRDIAAKDDFMGKCHVDLTELAKEMTHNLVLDLDVGVGQIHIQLCITGTASYEKLESQQSTKEIDWNEINAKYSLRNTIKSLKDVGFLQVILGSAEELVASGHCNPFAILEVGNSRVRTHTLYKTHNPSWDKTFNFNIKDVHDNLEVSIFSGDKNTELLGKVCIPLLNVTNGKRKAYALKKKDCIQRSHGSVLLTCRFVYNNVRAAIRTINPREMKVLEVEPKLNRKVLVKNIRRVSSQIEAVYAAIQFVNGLFQWTNYLHSFVAFVLFVVLSLYGDWWMPFMMLVLIFAYQYVAVGLFTQQTKGLLENSTGDSSDSESEFSELDDDELMGTKPNEERRKSIRQRLKQFQNVLIIVQTTLDQIANTVERVYNLFNWSVPYCSMLAVTVLCGAAILFYMVPVNYIVLAWGVNKFSKKLLKPNYIPNNELLDFLSRLPSDEELLMRKELRPHLLTKRKKSVRLSKS